MQKIITLFQRNHDGDHLVRDELTPGVEWVVAGEGQATRKFDGMCCMIRNGALYKRHEVKGGRRVPVDWTPASFQSQDPVTGNWVGWVPVGAGPEDQYFRAAMVDHLAKGYFQGRTADVTYELVGPNVQGGVEGFETHQLVRHGGWHLFRVPTEFAALREYMSTSDIEGVVWHHPDGRMVKIKGKDFGFTPGNGRYLPPRR